MSRCGRYEELISRFLHGELLLQEKDDLESHVAVCAACERLYREIAETDWVLRGIPEKLVEPPLYLRRRILANLPEPETRGVFGRQWGRWAAGLAGAVACALVAFALFRAQPPSVPQVASLPPASESPVLHPPPQEGPSLSRETPAPDVSPARKAAPAGKDAPPAVAAAPRVEVIREVKVYFYYPPAKNVAVTGDFNGWDPKGVSLAPAEKPGLWETTLKLRPGAYSYNFIVDGNVLVPDPNALNQSPDGYGGTNSIMLVKGGDSA